MKKGGSVRAGKKQNKGTREIESVDRGEGEGEFKGKSQDATRFVRVVREKKNWFEGTQGEVEKWDFSRVRCN